MSSVSRSMIRTDVKKLNCFCSEIEPKEMFSNRSYFPGYVSKDFVGYMTLVFTVEKVCVHSKDCRNIEMRENTN